MLHKTERVGLLVSEVFLGLSALAGMIGMLSGGIRFPSEWLQGTPFSDYTVPALCLGVVVGGSSIAAAAVTYLDRPLALPLAAASGASVIVFEVVEISVIPLSALGLAMQLFYVAVGIAILCLTWLGWRSLTTGRSSAMTS